jgi:hypothetical protein
MSFNPLRIVIAGPVSLEDEDIDVIIPSLLPWTDVPDGTAVVASLLQPNLSFDSSGAQSSVTLPTAAQLAANDGTEFTFKATGNMLSPVIVNAGAGTTIELVGGALGPGNFGASTYLPYEAMIAGYKYDLGTTQWKLFSLSLGSINSAQQQPTWVVAGGGLDSNSGIDGAHALATPGEAIRRLGGAVGGSVLVNPLGGAVDDWSRIFGSNGIAVACAATGTTLELAGKTFNALTDELLPSGLHLIANPETVVIAGLPVISIVDAPFACISTYGPIIALATNNTPGQKTVSAAAAPPGGWVIGSFVEFMVGGARLHGSTYQIINVTPVGPNFTLTFDRSVLYTGLAVSAGLRPVLSLTSDIHVEGNGMLINGNCRQAIEMQGVLDCHFSDIRIDGSQMVIGGSAGGILDTYSVNCSMRSISADGHGIMSIGFWCIGEQNIIDACIAKNCVSQGFLFLDAAVSVLSKCQAYGNVTGFEVGSDGGAIGVATTEGNVLSDCFAWGNSSNGFLFTQGASNISVSGCVAQYNAIGFLLDNSQPLGSPTNIKFSACSAVNNSQYGCHVMAGSKGSVFDGIDVSSNTLGGFFAEDDVSIDGFTCRGVAGGSAILINGGHTELTNYDVLYNQTGLNAIVISGGSLVAKSGKIRFTLANSTGFAISGASTRVWVDGIVATFDAACFLAQPAAGMIALDNVQVGGAAVGGSLGVNPSAGATVRVGRNVKLTGMAAGNQIVNNAGAFCSRSDMTVGAVTLAGLAAQAISWPDLTTADDVMAWLSDPNGGVPSPIRVVKTPGTGFTLAGSGAADTSKVQYVVL